MWYNQFMKLLKTNFIEVKKSKFYSYLFEVVSIEDIASIMKYLKKEHKKAVHFPYAYKIDNIIKKSDDKEPSNTAGTSIYNIINKKQLNNKLIVVVRYFGGIKLGIGPLARAYSKSANNLVSN